MKNNLTRDDKRAWFFFAILYLVIDYARLQDILPVISHLKPGLIIVLLLVFFIIMQGISSAIDTKQTRMIALFIALLMVYVPLARNNHFAFITVKAMLGYMPFILSVIICVRSMERLKTLILIMICIMIYITAYSIVNRGIGSGGYFSDENDLSLYINMWIPFCYYLFLHEKAFMKKSIYAIGFIIGLCCVVISFSRGGFVGLVAMFAVLWYFSHRKLLTLTLVIACAASIFFLGGEAYINEMSTVTDTNEGTAQARINSWKSAFEMFLDNPLGVGGNNFQVRFPEYQGDRFSRGMWGRVSHSLWFTLLPETGILGVIIYLMLLYYNIKDILKFRKINAQSNNSDDSYLYCLSSAMLASLAGFFASATFLSVLYYPHYWYMTAIIVAAANISRLRRESLATDPVQENVARVMTT